MTLERGATKGASIVWNRVGSALLLAGLLAASGCTLPRAPAGTANVARDSLQSFSLNGRFSVRQEGKGYVGSMRWRHAGERNELVVSSPLGQAVAEIVSDAGGARLTRSDGSSQDAEKVDLLLQSLIGYPLPLDRLVDWLRGRHPDGATLTLDDRQRPLSWRHEEWRIDYAYDSDASQALPSRLFVERLGYFELRLRIDEWQTPASEE
ncbi:lipoprotein insertase outer membrane protein LolB [Accumulibacter sp.]|uniref:lipoprotein insertase outer membrane protein LolB n=1 Tax=Accumulibacter sp. TaxID=2053492 RepID=UPI002609CCBD|nr:lipoprotein insertase outer membrane protein LolB [Accumulibacter sp.]